REIFLRVTRTSFFIGTAGEAKTSLGVMDSAAPQVNAAKTSSASLLTPTALAPGIVQGNVPAVPRPDSHAQSVQAKQSVSSQGTPGVLSCAFRGTLSLHATIQPGSPVVAEVPCGDPVLLIDQGLGATEIRTQDGKDGFILGLNLGHWSIQTKLPVRDVAAQAPSAWPSSTTTRPSMQAVSERPTANLISPSTSAPAPAADLIVSPASAATPPPESISASARVPVPTTGAISPSAPAPDSVAREDYVIGPEDVLAISVWGDPDLSTKAIVRSDGKIAIQLLGDVQASGLTTSQLREHLRDTFSKYLRTPLVSVIVAESHSSMVHVIGSVSKPGAYPLNRPLTVVELLVRAGGFAEFAKQENVIIMRYEGGTTSRLLFNYPSFVSGENMQQNILLRNRDLVIVP